MRRHVVLVALVLGCASQRDVVGAALGVAGPAIVEFHVRERAACIEIAKTREEATACMVLVDDRYVPIYAGYEKARLVYEAEGEALAAYCDLAKVFPDAPQEPCR